jgi:hypothetical protein
MTTVRELHSRLADLPLDAPVYACQDEYTGIAIIDADGRQLGSAS